MHVEEAEDLRLRIAEAVPDGAGLERGGFIRFKWGQFDDELHAQRPFAVGVALGQAELFVQSLADCADRAVAYDGELGADIHAGHEAFGRMAGLVHALIGEAQAFDFFAGEERCGDRSAGPDLDQASGHQLRADPLVELADGEHEAGVLVEEGRSPGQREGVVFDADEPSECAEKRVGRRAG